VTIRQPYLLFVGPARDFHGAKTAAGIRYWRPERCIGQWRSSPQSFDLGLPDLSFEAAAARGAATLVIGLAPVGGAIAPDWIPLFEAALDAGLDLAAGMHQRIGDIELLRLKATRLGRQIHDVRQPTRAFPVGTGRKRRGKRLLTVGTDCAVGKMYSTLAIERKLRARGCNATFRATGQTGLMIAGEGVCVDAIVADFIAGAVEWLTPDADEGHWDVIEGQGSLFHPGYAGVSLGLLHGAQPDAIVLCHDAGRSRIDGLPDYPLPDLRECIDLNLALGARTNPAIRCVGISANTARLSDAEAEAWMRSTGERLGLPCVDPVRTGVAPLVDALLS
jgi:uncharacterized NAD-dependent epimerase/dehydratase family protein